MIRAASSIIIAACIVAAPTAPALAQTSSPTEWSAHAAQLQIPMVVRSLGLAGKLSIWGANSGRAIVGLTSVEPGDVSKLKRALGSRVDVLVEPRFHVEDLVTRLAGVQRLQIKTEAEVRSAATSANRLLDTTPWDGGDRIVRTYTAGSSTYIVQCTVAAEMATTSGTPAMPTAGHCGSTGLIWDQGYYPGTGSTIYVAGTIGVDKVTSFGNNEADGELLEDDAYTAYTYVSSANTAKVTGPSFSTVGQVACADGSFTGYTCAGHIVHTGICAEEQEDDGTVVNVCHLDEATSTTRIVQSGDSGGPVLTTGTPVELEGLVSAGNSAGTDLLFSDVAGLISALSATVQ